MNGKKILIADDELSVRSLVKRLLGREYTVLEAEDGEEAINIAFNQQPALILMDILMPEIDGLTACYVLKMAQATKKIPVVMLTAVDYELNKKLSMDIMGADGYITKPFSPQKLINAVGQFLTDSK